MYMRSPNAKVLVREERVVLCNTRNGGLVLCQEKVQIKYNQFSLFM